MPSSRTHTQTNKHFLSLFLSLSLTHCLSLTPTLFSHPCTLFLSLSLSLSLSVSLLPPVAHTLSLSLSLLPSFLVTSCSPSRSLSLSLSLSLSFSFTHRAVRSGCNRCNSLSLSLSLSLLFLSHSLPPSLTLFLSGSLPISLSLPLSFSSLCSLLSQTKPREPVVTDNTRKQHIHTHTYTHTYTHTRSLSLSLPPSLWFYLSLCLSLPHTGLRELVATDAKRKRLANDPIAVEGLRGVARGYSMRVMSSWWRVHMCNVPLYQGVVAWSIGRAHFVWGRYSFICVPDALVFVDFVARSAGRILFVLAELILYACVAHLYGGATISRLLKICLFCKRAL